MHTYLWLAKDQHGKESAQRISALSAQESRAILEKAGFTDLRLQTDDITAEVSSQFKDAPRLSPRQQAKNLRQGPTTFLRVILLTVRDTAGVAILAYLWDRFDVARGRSLNLWVSIAIVAVVGLWIFAVRLNSYLYKALNEAREWRRPRQVLRLAGLLQTLGKLTGVNIPPQEFGRFQALALAWQGNLDQALKHLEVFKPKFSPWLYAVHVSQIYGSAHQPEQSLRFAELAVELNPGVAATHIDLAWKLLLYNGDLRRAREALETANRLEQTSIAKPFVLRNTGFLALREGRVQEAESLITEAEKIWTNTNQFFRHSNLMITKALLSQVHARLGNYTLAKNEYETARPWLEQSEEFELLEGCRAALGQSAPVTAHAR